MSTHGTFRAHLKIGDATRLIEAAFTNLDSTTEWRGRVTGGLGPDQPHLPEGEALVTILDGPYDGKSATAMFDPDPIDDHPHFMPVSGFTRAVTPQ